MINRSRSNPKPASQRSAENFLESKTTAHLSPSLFHGSRGRHHRIQRRRTTTLIGTKAFGRGMALFLCLVLGVLSVLVPPACAGTLPSSSNPLDSATATQTPDHEKRVPHDSTPITSNPSFITNAKLRNPNNIATSRDELAFRVRKTRGGARAKAKTRLASGGKGDTETKPVATTPAPTPTPPSFRWAILHNWLYFLSLGFNAVNIPYLIREVVDGPPADGAATTTRRLMPSAKSIALSGNVEAVDKILTFGGIAFLSALSDKYGRKPLIVWSSLGFALTNLLQVLAGDVARSSTAPGWSSTAILYLADFVDGCSSCMGPVCQAYVADCSLPSSLASNLGIFQGISIGGAFILAFPIGGVLGAKFGPKPAILMAAGFQLINCLIAASLTPESNAGSLRDGGNDTSKRIRFSEVNPITGLQKLFGIGEGDRPGVTLLRTASLAYFFLSLARGALDAQFVNYTNVRFGWTQAQSGPVLVMVGLMLAIVPRLVVPRLGLQRSINFGLVVYAIGLSSAGLVTTPTSFVLSIAIIAFGCVAIPALQALLANLAPPGESGALLGAVGSLSELTGAIGSSMYATLLATFASSLSPATGGDEADAPSSFLLSILPNIPGMHFLVGASFCLIGWAISAPGLNRNRDHPALKTAVDKELLSASDL